MKTVCATPEATEGLGERLGRRLSQPETIACFGELGAGKTTFVRGVCRGLEAPEAVTSPTFVLQHVYRGRLPIYHFDAYRLSGPRDLLEIGWEECDDGVVLLEWSERVEEVLPAERLEVHLRHVPEGREVELIPRGPRLLALLEGLC
ncbi:MAG: tRNA (adenosine(37)-N6)-threonylcarbamoyltransferase complex ATPase subunit type 1 TsaE [Candidatus Eremiobacterota bacterium]